MQESSIISAARPLRHVHGKHALDEKPVLPDIAAVNCC